MIPKLSASVLAGMLALGFALPAVAETTIPTGTDIHATLSSPDINTKNAQAGQQFTMQVTAPYPNGDPSFAGATLYGHIVSVRSAGQGRKPQLQLAFDSIRLGNGESAPLSGEIVTIAHKSDNTTARKALGAGAGAAVGSQTVGRIIGGAAGGVIGILGGAAAGFAYASNNKANFDIATGAAATIQTTAPASVRRQAR